MNFARKLGALAFAGLAGISMLLGSATLAGAVPHAAAAPAATNGSFVGQVDGSNAFIGIVSNGRNLLAYVCDGDQSGATAADWFHGTTDGTNVDATTANGAHLVATLAPNGADGYYTDASGVVYSFHADVAGTDSGLFRGDLNVDGGQWVGGWVVLHDDVRGALFETGPAVADLALTLRGAAVSAQDIRTGALFFDGIGAISPVQVLPASVGLF
jgi:hypothetical protein